MDGPYIFSMILAFSGIFKIMLSHHDQCHLWFNLLNLDIPESKTRTLTKGMNEVSIHGSYIFGNKQNLDIGRHRKRQRNLDPREALQKPERQN